jgi:hypothetical protein
MDGAVSNAVRIVHAAPRWSNLQRSAALVMFRSSGKLALQGAPAIARGEPLELSIRLFPKRWQNAQSPDLFHSQHLVLP